jgi:hypothetical protein
MIGNMQFRMRRLMHDFNEDFSKIILDGMNRI